MLDAEAAAAAAQVAASQRKWVRPREQDIRQRRTVVST